MSIIKPKKNHFMTFIQMNSHFQKPKAKDNLLFQGLIQQCINICSETILQLLRNKLICY